MAVDEARLHPSGAGEILGAAEDRSGMRVVQVRLGEPEDTRWLQRTLGA
jgi:hypothetical protein